MATGFAAFPLSMRPSLSGEHSKPWMDYLTFDVEEVDDGVSKLEAMASAADEQQINMRACWPKRSTCWTGHGIVSRIPTAPSTTGWSGTTISRSPSKAVNGTRSH